MKVILVFVEIKPCNSNGFHHIWKFSWLFADTVTSDLCRWSRSRSLGKASMSRLWLSTMSRSIILPNLWLRVPFQSYQTRIVKSVNSTSLQKNCLSHQNFVQLLLLCTVRAFLLMENSIPMSWHKIEIRRRKRSIRIPGKISSQKDSNTWLNGTSNMVVLGKRLRVYIRTWYWRWSQDFSNQGRQMRAQFSRHLCTEPSGVGMLR